MIINFSEGKDMGIVVKSSDFKNGGYIPVKYTCDGTDISPEISWSNFPENTKSFVIIMDDPDAPVGTFTHWIVYDIPANINKFSENFPKVADINGIKQGINDFRKVGYGGPCPPRGKPHRYFIKIYALDVSNLNIPAMSSRKTVEEAMKGHIIDEGYLMGLYGR
ncbi:MAG: YbhB/YbcL family Raf kinase inhibitor-like protein [Aquificota bacterium]|nr:MAG: YbhB/YbcL family Raf kinase inhibitor-like protein [Aquificota bacterium]